MAAAAPPTTDAAAEAGSDSATMEGLDQGVPGAGGLSGLSGVSAASILPAATATTVAQIPVLVSLPAPQRLHWYGQAQRMVAAHVKLLVEPATSSALATALKDSAVGKLTGTDRTDCVLIMYDPKQSGEAITQPHLRCAPLRDDHLAKHLGGVLDGRRDLQTGADSVIHGDVICLFDGGRHGELTNFPPAGGPRRV
jgi:hypothetical protein